MENDKVLSSWNLWKDNLISDDTFYGILMKLKGTPTTSIATQGQINYIRLLQSQGKIPEIENISTLKKVDAQKLIHDVVNSPVRNPNIPNSEPENQIGGYAPISVFVEDEESKNLYKDNSQDY